MEPVVAGSRPAQPNMSVAQAVVTARKRRAGRFLSTIASGCAGCAARAPRAKDLPLLTLIKGKHGAVARAAPMAPISPLCCKRKTEFRVHALLLPAGSDAVPLWPLWIGQETGHLPQTAQAWIAASGFEAKPGRVLPVPGEAGALCGAVFGVEAPDAKSRDPFLTANLV